MNRGSWKLKQEDLVSRVESEADRRVKMVSLTKFGKALISLIFKRYIVEMTQTFEGFSEDELDKFQSLLKHVGRRAELLHQKRGDM